LETHTCFRRLHFDSISLSPPGIDWTLALFRDGTRPAVQLARLSHLLSVCRPRISVPGKISTMHLVEVVVVIIPEAAEEMVEIKVEVAVALGKTRLSLIHLYFLGQNKDGRNMKRYV
jgi:hypothetical protein